MHIQLLLRDPFGLQAGTMSVAEEGSQPTSVPCCYYKIYIYRHHNFLSDCVENAWQ